MNRPHGALEVTGLAPASSALEGMQWQAEAAWRRRRERNPAWRRVLFFQATGWRCRLTAAAPHTTSSPSVIAEKT